MDNIIEIIEQKLEEVREKLSVKKEEMGKTTLRWKTILVSALGLALASYFLFHTFSIEALINTMPKTIWPLLGRGAAIGTMILSSGMVLGLIGRSFNYKKAKKHNRNLESEIASLEDLLSWEKEQTENKKKILVPRLEIGDDKLNKTLEPISDKSDEHRDKFNESEYLEYYLQGILREKLRNMYTDNQLEFIEGYLEEVLDRENNEKDYSHVLKPMK